MLFVRCVPFVHSLPSVVPFVPFVLGVGSGVGFDCGVGVSVAVPRLFSFHLYLSGALGFQTREAVKGVRVWVAFCVGILAGRLLLWWLWMGGGCAWLGSGGVGMRLEIGRAHV